MGLVVTSREGPKRMHEWRDMCGHAYTVPILARASTQNDSFLRYLFFILVHIKPREF